MFFRTGARWLPGLLAGLALSQGALASGLQVDPVTVAIDGRSGIVWLSNVGDAPLDAQVRVYRWTQDSEGEHLAATDALVASPPQIKVAQGGRQLVRLVLAAPPGAATGACEDTYRITVNELPPPRAEGERGLRYVMQYSIPVFATSRACGKIAPALTWQLEQTGGEVRLAVTNAGRMHAQLSQLSFIDAAGQRTELNPGLVGYVLPGARMTFPLKLPPALFAGDGQIEVFANGAKVVQTLSLGAAAAAQ